MSKKYYDESILKANTPNGRDWLQKYLHPPGAKGQAYNGYPDKSTTPCVHAEYRLTSELWKPIQYPGGFSANTMGILTGPGILFPAFYCNSAQASDNPDWRAFYKNDQLSVDNMMANFGRVRVAYNSVTSQLDATDFSNTGMQYHCQFYPSTYQINVSAISDMIKRGAIKSKAFGKNYDDFVKVGDEPRALNISTKRIQVVKLGFNVTSPTDITMMSPKMYTARSTEGLFSVYQCSQDVNAFKSVAQYQFNSGAAAASPMLCAYEINIAGTTYIEPFTDVDAATYVYDAEWSDWSWSYTYYVGYSPASTGIAAPALVNFKHVMGVEIAPITKSILNTQTMPAALFDPTALDTAAIITQSRADGMPAEFNLLGGLAAIAKSIAPSMLKPLSQAITGADSSAAEGSKAEKSLEKAAEVQKATESASETLQEVKDRKMHNATRVSKRRNRRVKPPQSRKILELERRLFDMQLMCANTMSSPSYQPRAPRRARSTSRARSNSRTRGKPQRPRTVSFRRQ